MIDIISFDLSFFDKFEEFRLKAISEGNDSISFEKLNPQTFEGQILLCIYKEELISVSAIEPSHYTGDPQIAARICRYHVLQEYRNKFLFCGFQMLKKHVEWADWNDFEVVYFTHDTRNRALNSLYQKKKKYGFGISNVWFDDPTFQSFALRTDMLFQVSSKSDLLQFVYVRKKNKNFNWQPKNRIVLEHDIAKRYLL